MINNLQYAIYKGKGGKFGAVQFNLQSPHPYRGKDKSFDGRFKGESIFETIEGKTRLKEGWKIREGCVFMDITGPKGSDVYDWDNKIIMALSITDIGKILLSLVTGDECKLMHDPGAKTDAQGTVKKYLTITSPRGPVVGVILSATHVSGPDKRTHTVPLSGDEVLVLRTLFQTAVSRALNW